MLASLMVFDDFYERPHEVREQALSLHYRLKTGAFYPGREAHGGDLEHVRLRIRALIPDDCDCPCPKEPAFVQGKFRLALASDVNCRPDGVHEDVQSWSAIVYLSLPQHCTGGIGLYRHRATGVTKSTPEWEESVFGSLDSDPSVREEGIRQHMRDLSNWEQIGEVPMAFNRLVLLRAHCFHASTGIFGGDPASGRLTQHFEFYTLGDWMRLKGLESGAQAQNT